MSVVVLDAASGTVVFRDSVDFDQPFIPSSDRAEVHASPSEWTRGLERMLERLAANVDRSAVRALSGSAQQHGSVYCGDRPDLLTRQTSPIWMDSSTVRECEEIETALGGPDATARLTGSRAYPRFTGPQIRKFAREEPDAYRRTSHIHLVSSYLASVLVGAHAPVDYADASGMTLMDIRTRTWSAEATNATAPDLAAKLPPVVPSNRIVGTLAEHWQRRFGLPAARVIAWSGDNPCSLIGTGVVEEGQLAISLGTSDTIFGPMRTPRVSADGTGHVFASPTGEYMGITVFRNGSLARERVRDEFGLTWDGFSAALRSTRPESDGPMILPWFEPEITPSVRYSAPVRVGLDDAPAEAHVRAVVEGQAIAMARHSEWMKVQARAIHATGGASANTDILQVVADVFDAPISRFDATDAAAIGAALRALQAETGGEWRSVVRGFVTPLPDPVVPIERNVRVYHGLLKRYARIERAILSF